MERRIAPNYSTALQTIWNIPSNEAANMKPHFQLRMVVF
jgi:hypothetical protein